MGGRGSEPPAADKLCNLTEEKKCDPVNETSAQGQSIKESQKPVDSEHIRLCLDLLIKSDRKMLKVSCVKFVQFDVVNERWIPGWMQIIYLMRGSGLPEGLSLWRGLGRGSGYR